MRIRKVPPSQAVLTYWNIAVNKINGEMHFIGYEVRSERARLSTPIRFFDEKKGVGITVSGSKYQVLGKASKPHESAMLLFKINLMSEGLLTGSNFEWKYPFITDETLH